ncbi:ATP-binding protein [Roseovarius aestuarii]|uniref:histidine kinase n=1 Tax=Roseovarius aestuarii TaxID=475083 RepID=A0A1X7BMJ2_9RHOB|nr:ATP-binding protein [Roseovarius aestuarii]SMC10744.1 Blue-light-activated protein [Roseovarius aestuarii]
MTIGTEPATFERNPEAADLVWDAIEALSEGIAVYDSQHRLVTCNQRYVDMFPMIGDLIERGAVWEDLVRAGAERGQYADAIGRVEEYMAERLASGRAFTKTEGRQKRIVALTDGSFYETRFSPTSRGGFVVTNIDVTERLQAEAVVREQENILRTVLETSPMVIVMARLEDGRILYRSPGAVSLFGNTSSALEHYVKPIDRENYISELRKKGRVDDYHITLRNAAGELCATTSWGRLVEFEGDTYVVTAIMDLSDQQEREAMIRRVLEACPTPIQMTKADTGEVLFSSPETISLFGRVDSSKQFYADPDTRAGYLKKLRRKGSVTEFKAQYLNAKGERFWGAVSARLIDYDGEEVIVSHTRDLSEQMQIEEELAQQQDQLYQNEKLSAMGELLAGVAHELNNPLSVVVGHSLMLREDCKDAETLRQVEKISHAAERCAKIVKTFLTMARQQPARMQRVDINEIIQTAVDVARYGDKGDGASMECRLAEGLPKLCADPDQITQVFINLILNAEQAMRDGETGSEITVTSRATKDKKGVEIIVKDDGPGIPDSIRGRVFEPFFTTKDVGEGTGIGLALCHRIIQSHNGSISLSSAPKGGSVFRIFLPVDVAAPPKPETRQIHQPTDRKIRILILDDETEVAELNAEILTRSGFEVDVFSQASKAVQSMQQHEYGLILSDLNMPETDGRGFFEIIKRDFPHLIDKTGFVTGDTMGRASQTFLAESKRPCVEKPVSPKELRGFVADIIASAEQEPE